jgi:hypothetical protein
MSPDDDPNCLARCESTDNADNTRSKEATS